MLDSYGAPDRISCAEAWVTPESRLARYVRPDEMHQAFNFDFLDARWDATAISAVIEDSLRSNDNVGAPTTWVLSNHDVVHARARARPEPAAPYQVTADDPQPDAVLGLRRRARRPR